MIAMRWIAAALAVAGLAGGAGTLAPASLEAAEKAGLAGSWSGGGTVSFGTGTNERARCRATYTPTGKASYNLNAHCATASGSVSQTASLRGSGNSYRGSFYNSDFDASGSISVTVSGSSQTVRINSTKGSALLRLSR